jgi:WD40 repeat protein
VHRVLVLAVVAACGNRSEPRPGSGSPDVTAPAVAALPPGKPLDLAPKAKAVYGDGPRHGSSVEQVTFSADGSRLASLDRDGRIYVWDVASGKPIAAARSTVYRPFVAFAGADLVTKPPDDFKMVTRSVEGGWIYAELDEGIVLYEIATGRRVPYHGRRFDSISIVGDRFVAIGDDKSVDSGRFDGLHQAIAVADRGMYLATLSPDGKRIALAGKDGVGIYVDGEVKPMRVEGLDDATGTTTLAWSPDGAQLALSIGGRTVTLVDTRRGTSRELVEEASGNDIACLAFSPDGARIAGGNRGGRVRVWDAKTGKPLHAQTGHLGTTWDVTVSADGGTLASAGDERALVWKPQLATFGDHEHWVGRVAVSADGTRLASCSDYGDLLVRELPAGTIVAKLQIPDSECERLAFAGDRIIAATGNAAQVFPIADGATPRTITLDAGRKYGTSSFAASRDGALVANGGDDGQIAVHATANGARRWLAQMPQDPDEEGQRFTVHALAFDETATQLAAVADDEKLRIYDARTGRLLRTQPFTLAGPGWLTALAFMGTRVAVGASTGELFVIDAKGKTVFTANQTIGGIFSMAATKTQLFTGGASGDVVAWDVP